MNDRLRWRMIHASHRVTFSLAQRWPSTFPMTFVIGYPKSGTTWVCQMVADCLQLPYPRKSMFPVGCEAVVHGHETLKRSFPRGVYVSRDGRDCLTSFFFHFAKELKPGDHPPMSRKHRTYFPNMTNREHVRENIATFVERMLTTPHATKVPWGEHVRSFFRVEHPSFVHVRYEDLYDDPVPNLARVIEGITGKEADLDAVRATCEKFSFAKQSSSGGGEDRTGFVRKGGSGDWRNHFTPEAREIFHRLAGDALIEAGYEPDDAWVRGEEGVLAS